MKRLFTLLLAAVIFVGAMVFLAPKALAATTVTVTDSAGVNMREGPGTSYNKVIAIPANTQLTVQETKEADGYTWGKVTYDGNTGWIALEFTDYDPNQSQPTPPSSNGTWERHDGKWYYYIDGVMQTGWQCDGGKWYYMDANGVMQTGWLSLSGKWYYLNGSGVMQTGWLKQGAVTYYLDSNGVMQTGWTTVQGSTYYFNSSGAMYTGWLEYNNSWYYMKANGAMAVGKAMIDGQANKFDRNGKWLGLAKYMTSQACVDLIKQYEGFSAKPYWDVVQWTVGYGTRCPDDKKAYYDQYGITTEEAEILLRDFIIGFEESVDAFIEEYGLNLTPGQYDALISFSYNCGAGWTTEYSGTFHNAIKNGATGSELIRAFGLWCSAGGEVLPGLIDRRKSEANMYLNGEYSQTIPSNFCHVYFNVNGGEKVPRVQCYDSNEQPAPAETPTHETKYFAGWYTSQTGGTKVTKLTKAHDGTTLYAHWSDTPVDPGASDPTPPAAPSNLVTVTGDVVNVRKGPGTDYERVTQLFQGEKIAILELKTVDGYVWGRYSAGWIRLDYTDYNPASFQLPGRWSQESGKWYYIQNGQKVKSWNLIDGKWYYFNSSGVMQTGWIKNGGNWYYLNASGIMQTGWIKNGGNWYYLNKSGIMQTGWLEYQGATYYLDADGIMVTGQYTIDGKEHLFDADGIWQGEILRNGWTEEDGNWYYYKDGVKQTGWLQDGENRYYLNASGVRMIGWIKNGGSWYYLNAGGVMQTGWIRNRGNWYYLNKSGIMQTGWLEYRGDTYYLDADGIMVTGQYTIDGKVHLFDADGILQSEIQSQKNGWAEEDGNWYYYKDGVKQTGWLQDGENRYYLNASGVRMIGWIKNGGSWYYLNAGGVMQTGWIKNRGNWYYLNKSGIMQTGWLEYRGDTYYLDAEGIMVTDQYTIDGKVHLFDADGILQSEIQSQKNGWTEEGGNWYYYEDGVMQTGWLQDGENRYYLNASGVRMIGWIKNGGSWYYLNAGGAMQTGWLQLGNTWYYLKSSGEMVTGSYTIGPVTYKFDSNGAWIG